MAAPTVLLVEDDAEDINRIRESLAEGRGALTLHIRSSSAQAIHALTQEIQHPSLILLGLNSAASELGALLTHLKKTPVLRTIPVVVLLRSAALARQLRPYELHANSCVLKPTSDEDFRRSIRAIRRFWLDLSVLPIAESRR